MQIKILILQLDNDGKISAENRRWKNYTVIIIKNYNIIIIFPLLIIIAQVSYENRIANLEVILRTWDILNFIVRKY